MQDDSKPWYNPPPLESIKSTFEKIYNSIYSQIFNTVIFSLNLLFLFIYYLLSFQCRVKRKLFPTSLFFSQFIHWLIFKIYNYSRLPFFNFILFLFFSKIFPPICLLQSNKPSPGSFHQCFTYTYYSSVGGPCIQYPRL